MDFIGSHIRRRHLEPPWSSGSDPTYARLPSTSSQIPNDRKQPVNNAIIHAHTTHNQVISNTDFSTNQQSPNKKTPEASVRFNDTITPNYRQTQYDANVAHNISHPQSNNQPNESNNRDEQKEAVRNQSGGNYNMHDERLETSNKSQNHYIDDGATNRPMDQRMSNNYGCGSCGNCINGFPCARMIPGRQIISCPTRQGYVKIIAKLVIFLFTLASLSYCMFVVATGWAYRNELLAITLLLLLTRLICRKNWFFPTQYWKNLEPADAHQPPQVELAVPTSCNFGNL